MDQLAIEILLRVYIDDVSSGSVNYELCLYYEPFLEKVYTLGLEDAVVASSPHACGRQRLSEMLFAQ